jgi:hypothetical protein
VEEYWRDSLGYFGKVLGPMFVFPSISSKPNSNELTNMNYFCVFESQYCPGTYHVLMKSEACPESPYQFYDFLTTEEVGQLMGGN